MKPTHRKSWAWNLLMLDLTFGPSLKVKRWFTGFGELSFQCVGPVFTHGVRMGGWVGGWREEVCPACISETIRCRKFILGRDIG